MRSRVRHNIAEAIIILIGIISMAYPSPQALAFYEWSGEKGSANIRGFAQLTGIANKNPQNHPIYKNEIDESGGGVLRLLALAQIGDNIGIDFNAYQTYISTTADLSNSFYRIDVERSPSVEWSFKDAPHAKSHLAIDRFSVRMSFDRTDITLGRQPINLATCFYFTPNDFFAPFSANTFYRVYKPGVDAVRAEVRIAELSQLSLIGVLGYKQETGSVNGWSRDYSQERSSAIARISTSLYGFEWAALGGAVREASVIGGSLQGEIAEWLGVRGEGHYNIPRDTKQEPFTEINIGLEHRFENSLNIRVEQFHHGGGYSSVKDYTVSSTARHGLYLGRSYTALGIGYEFTPLFKGEAVSIANWTDSSYLLSFYSVYSVSDEAEFSAGLSIPIGSTPRASVIESEFGFYPYTFSIEYRVHF